jgi:hypothetical protein
VTKSSETLTLAGRTRGNAKRIFLVRTSARQHFCRHWLNRELQALDQCTFWRASCRILSLSPCSLLFSGPHYRSRTGSGFGGSHRSCFVHYHSLDITTAPQSFYLVTVPLPFWSRPSYPWSGLFLELSSSRLIGFQHRGGNRSLGALPSAAHSGSFWA